MLNILYQQDKTKLHKKLKKYFLKKRNIKKYLEYILLNKKTTVKVVKF